MRKQRKMEYESPVVLEIDLLSREAFAASPLDPYHNDNNGDEDWDD